MNEPMLRISAAAHYLGVHPQTLRRWTSEGQLSCQRLGKRNERRYAEGELRRFAVTLYHQPLPEPTVPPRRAVLYVRVSGSTGQETSLAAQEEELRALCAAADVEIVAITRDRASGLNERRVGLLRALGLVERGEANEIWVTHADRLARFGLDWLRSLLAAYKGALVIAHPQAVAAPADELLADFMALVSSFAGRLYGQRSAARRRQLLDAAVERLDAYAEALNP
jgi:putative resolvase